MIFPWQQSQWRQLLSQFVQQRLPQALLFSGPDGLGKTEFTIALMQRILCKRDAGIDDLACGECRSCRLFLAESHPDVFLVQAETEGKAIKIDQLRSLIESLQHTAHQGGPQLAMIAPAENMNRSSANALLKTLEEPNGAVHIFLVSHSPQSLPATILSRCQRLRFECEDQQQALAWLKSHIEDQDHASLLLRMADGAPMKAKILNEANYLTCRDDVLRAVLHAIKGQSDPIASIPLLVKHDIFMVLDALLTLWMDLIRYQSGLTASLIHADREKQIVNLSAAWHIDVLFKHYQAIIEGIETIKTGIAVNQQLLLEKLFLQIAAKE